MGMIAQVLSATIIGIDAYPIVVEVDLQRGTPLFIMVGLPDKAVEESKERVRTAMRNSDFDFPGSKIICNLAPGDVRKEGPSLDLPIAIAILAADEQIPYGALKDTLLMGELGLDGMLRPVSGALNVALSCHERGVKRLILPLANADEAAMAPGVEVFGVESLNAAVWLLNGSMVMEPHQLSESAREAAPEYGLDYSDVKGQRHAIRALEIAAAGGHNMLMTGPPGSGKTMLARRLPTILPLLSAEEAIEVTRIYSASGSKATNRALVRERPFRSPHHTASHAAIVGGGKNPKPGEVSMAHKGVLFLDEMPEFDRSVLEALRQPLEDGLVTVSRVQASLTFPAECILIGAMNPCPCGYRGLPEQKCVSSPSVCGRYAQRISGPLMDRIDLHLEVPRLKPEELMGMHQGESSATIRERVYAARERQHARLGNHRVNAKMTPKEIRDGLALDAECEQFMKLVAARMSLSARVFDRVLKVGRTIADLAGDVQLRKQHLAEAIQYRQREE